ncbi:hypothetical protein BSKO_13071 [Bryopsis sp. KO-2023]|nr:hypothetical protein BSKO_13071 [Bryopsis sp. KO-2023]
MGGRSKSMKLFKVKIQEELNKGQPSLKCPMSMTPTAARSSRPEEKSVKTKPDANHPVRKYGMELRSVKTPSLKMAEQPPVEKGTTTPAKKKRTKIQKEKTKETRQENGNKACTSCGTHKTAQWRAGPYGPKTLCNACGVRYSRARLGGAKPRTKAKKRKQDKVLPGIMIKRTCVDGSTQEEGVRKPLSNVVVLKTNDLKPCPKEDPVARTVDAPARNEGECLLMESGPESNPKPECGSGNDVDVADMRTPTPTKEFPCLDASKCTSEPANFTLMDDSVEENGGAGLVHCGKAASDDFNDVLRRREMLDAGELQLNFGLEDLRREGIENGGGVGIEEVVESGVLGTEGGDSSGGKESREDDGVFETLGMELVDAWNIAEHIGFNLSLGRDPAVHEDTQAKLAGQLEATGFPGDEILHGLFSGAEGARVLGLAECERGDEVRATLERINELRFEVQGAEASAAAVRKVLSQAIDKMEGVREKLRDAIETYHGMMLNFDHKIDPEAASPSAAQGSDGPPAPTPQQCKLSPV